MALRSRRQILGGRLHPSPIRSSRSARFLDLGMQQRGRSMADTRFQTCLAEVLRHEGGYVDHPTDPGGATNMGITHKTLARWRKVSPWWDLPKSAVKTMARSEAAQIYRALYWDV